MTHVKITPEDYAVKKGWLEPGIYAIEARIKVDGQPACVIFNEGWAVSPGPTAILCDEQGNEA